MKGGKKHPTSSQLIYRQIPLLHTVAKTTKNPRLRRQILDLSPTTVKALGVIADHALSGKVPFSKKQTEIVNKNRKPMSILAKSPMASKKRVLQKGAFFGVLSKILPGVIAAITGLVGRR